MDASYLKRYVAFVAWVCQFVARLYLKDNVLKMIF